MRQLMPLHWFVSLCLFFCVGTIKPASAQEAANSGTDATESPAEVTQTATDDASQSTTDATTTDESSGDTWGEDEEWADDEWGDEWGDDEWDDAEDAFEDSEASIDELLEEPMWDDTRFLLGGYYRVIGTAVQNHDTDASDRDKRLNFFQQRLRLMPEISFNDKIKFKMDAIVGEGLHPCHGNDAARMSRPCGGIFGANGSDVLSSNLADQQANFTLARFWGEALTPIGLVRVGRQPSHWGLGILVNDGLHESEFGDPHYGDTYDRVLFATKPLGAESDLNLALIYDKISEGVGNDQLPTLANDKDDIHEYVLALLYTTAPLDFGIYQVARFQKRPSNNLFITDIYGRLDIGLIYAGFEMLWLYGATRALPFFDQNELEVVRGERTTIGIYNWAAEFGLRFDWYDAKIKIGSAHGDQNSTIDKDVSGLSFKPDYNIGLIMFDYALNNLMEQKIASQFATLNTLQRAGLISTQDIADLGLAADLARTRGGVSNAFYINPILQFKPFEGFVGKLGILWAEANDAIAVIGSGANAKYAANLGWEFDAGFDYTWRDHFKFGLEGGIFLPGAVFERPETIVDPVTGSIVQLATTTVKPDPAYLGQAKISYLFD